MSPLVHGHDGYVGVEVAIEGTYGTAPGSGYQRIPLLGEGFETKRAAYPKDRSMGATGAQETADYGRSWHEGSITVIPRYNSTWFNWLLCHLMGGCEDVQSGVRPSGTASPGAYSTHIYMPQSFRASTGGSESGVAPGLTFRITKSGGTTAGKAEVFTGSIITRMTIEQPEGDVPRATFNFIGMKSSIDSYAAMAAVDSGIIVDPRDFDRGNIWWSSPPNAATKAVGWQFVVESGIEFAPSFLNSPDVIEKPGHTGKWSVQARVDSLLIQDEYNTSGYAYRFNSGAYSGARVRLTSLSEVIAAVPYELDIMLRRGVVTKVENGITTTGAPKTSYTIEGLQATYTTAESAINADTPGMCLIQTVGQSAAYATSAQGGNPPEAMGVGVV